ncbi:hypothetical protein LCGC14_2233320 [marine sediment metagenome]|uniref:Uncharacterized protein n=1 Tax=marine sediment metagenome TaxID=412755 RepID=A0A0F9G2P1_9ZZZZ
MEPKPIYLSRDEAGECNIWSVKPAWISGGSDGYYSGQDEDIYTVIPVDSCRVLFGRLPRKGRCIKLIISEPEGE